MILLLLAIVAIVLFVMSYLLIKKNQSFTALIGNSETNLKFLKQIGSIYALLGLGSLVVGFFNNKFWAILYLAVIILFSGFFSLTLSKKIKQHNL